MGKITGFRDYPRVACPHRPPLERIEDFAPFRQPLPPEARREQAGRCMDCGVPFCQAGVRDQGAWLGCPLHNRVPEWNDMLWRGNGSQALSRLLKTNCFPEFTGRVCPAPCEKACVCGTFGQPVTIRDNELAIIEEAFARGELGPRPPDKRSGKTIAVVGSGPAGLAAAYYLNRRGHTVTVLEQSPRPGGLLTYGIPAMKLEKAVVERRLALMEAEGVVFRTGVAVGKDLSPEELDRTYDGVIFACGAQAPRTVPWAQDGQPGFCYGLDYLTQQAVALEEGRAPTLTARGKQVAVVGAGDTASDCIAVALRQGCTGLTQLIRKPASHYGEEAFAGDAQAEASARFQGPIQRFSTQIKTLLRGEEGDLTGAVLDTPQGEEEIPLDLVIVASGFTGCQESSLQARQAMPRPEKVFSAGDMVLGASLVVLAIADGRRAAGEADRFLMGYTNLI